jgi:hypothetical protein
LTLPRNAAQDCLSLLEKRVRSRCQSHVLQLIPPSSFSAFTDLAKRLLRADEHVWEEKKGQEGREWAETWNAEVEVSNARRTLSARPSPQRREREADALMRLPHSAS